MKGYRTFLFAGSLSVLGALQGLDWVHIMPNNPDLSGFIVLALGLAIAGLRLVTTTPAGKAM